MESYEARINKAKYALEKADYILLGAGAGLSAAAGLDYSGKRFADNFSDLIEKYGLTDMYTATFYPFSTPEESWAHWARHIDVNRFSQRATLLYMNLLKLACQIQIDLNQIGYCRIILDYQHLVHYAPHRFH